MLPAIKILSSPTGIFVTYAAIMKCLIQPKHRNLVRISTLQKMSGASVVMSQSSNSTKSFSLNNDQLHGQLARRGVVGLA